MQTTNYFELLGSYHQAASETFKKGQWLKAARVLRDALRESEEVGEMHDGLIDSANELAENLMAQHKYNEAEELYRAVLEVREKMLGTSHPQVLESMQRLAILQVVSFRAETLGKNFDGIAAAS